MSRISGYLPSVGHFRNPLYGGKYGNIICLCGSKKKIKKCCGFNVYANIKYEIILSAMSDFLNNKLTIQELSDIAENFAKSQELKNAN